ncbi:MAG TPA: 16S rRNA (cytosine(1402)-N(4))-methyltransferase RsmH [Candidatus Brocadiia bacterium]|nr:16S rRNA (cytosine(1402)-N(4))-methyltransferase RsmH [Candidatus Brocadiia bacterium]
MTEARHIPVMLNEALACLAPSPGQILLDVTAGCGGYSAAILPRLGPAGLLIATDRDPQMIAATRARLETLHVEARFRLFIARFSEIEQALSQAGVTQVDAVVADFGVASPQIDDPARGFSFRSEGPLSMRMDPGEGPTAEEIVNHWPEQDLVNLFQTLGQERFSRRIAARICQRREQAPFKTTLQLADAICSAVPRGPRRLHPARRCFQAIRMACNRELEEIQALLDAMPRVLKTGGVACCLSYHSLEDALVKRSFLQGVKDGVYEHLHRKPLRPSAAEAGRNPRARSAKLRAVRRTGAPLP